jgi:hypothetical protein
MTQQNLDFGTASANDGENLFSAFTKIQEMFTELYEGSVHAVQYGLVGDGSDETALLQQLFDENVGKTIHFEEGKTYGYNPSPGLTIPAGTILRTHGSVIKKRSFSTSYTFVIQGDVDIDRLEHNNDHGASNVGVRINGSNVSIGEFINEAATTNGINVGTYNALQIGNGTDAISNIRIGRFRSQNWDRPLMVQGVTDVEIGFIDIDTYMRGLYVKDTVNGRFHGAWMRNTSANALSAPGENGVLVESVAGVNSTQNLWFHNFVVEDAGEHGYRIGGAQPVDAVYFLNCIARRPGSGSGTDSGGCGFKALGPTTSNSLNHTNINYINCVAEDGLTSHIDTNWAGFHLGKIFGGSVVNPQVRNSLQGTNRAFSHGITVLGCQDIVITSPNIFFPAGSGIYIFDATSGGGTFWGALQSRIHIVGGNIISAGVYGIEVVAANINFRRIAVTGVLIEPGTDAGDLALSATTSGSGVFSECQFDGTIRSGAATDGLISAPDWLVTVRGRFVGTNTAANGSTWADATNGVFKVRRAGAWTEMQPLDADLTSWAAVTRASGFDTFVATPSSANLRALLTDETGTGAAVFANSPSLVTPTLGVATATSVTVGNTGLIVGSSTPFSDSAGTLTLQNVDALDATTEATIEAAIDTLANLTSVQGRAVTLADAGANAFFGWDDTAGGYENLTASEALTIIKTVDGTGSGLDADLLDGSEATAFALLAGRSGGQTLNGGSGAADALTLQATSGVGAGSENIIFKVGSNGATQAGRITGGSVHIVGSATSAQTITGVVPGLQVLGSGGGNSSFAGVKYSNDANGNFCLLGKSRGGLGTHTIVQADDTLGRFAFLGSDGANFQIAAQIDVQVDGTPGTGDMPGRLRILTCPDGSTTPTERLRIDNKGNVVVNTAAIATTATDGFLYVPSCAGTPTGTPTTYTGRVPLVVDTTNNKLYFYSTGAWRDAGP